MLADCIEDVAEPDEDTGEPESPLVQAVLQDSCPALTDCAVRPAREALDRAGMTAGQLREKVVGVSDVDEEQLLDNEGNDDLLAEYLRCLDSSGAYDRLTKEMFEAICKEAVVAASSPRIPDGGCRGFATCVVRELRSLLSEEGRGIAEYFQGAEDDEPWAVGVETEVGYLTVQCFEG